MSLWTRMSDGFSRFAALFNKAGDYLPLVAGMALTIAAILIARHRINAVETDIREKSAPVAVVVASCQIPKGTALSEQHLAKLSVPSSGTSRRNVPAREFELLVGARTKASIEPGEPILWTDVDEPFELDKFSQAIPPGRRALTFAVDLVASFSGLIRPGDRVDISLSDPAAKTGTAWFYDIPVIAVDRHFDRPPDSETAAEISSITISVTPEEGRRLAAVRDGSLRWFLRNPDDRSRPSPVSGPSSVMWRPVEIWKAGVRETRAQTASIEVTE